MNDIVDRLRGQEPLHLGDRSAAADVIDRLRAESEKYRTALEQIVAPFEDLNFVSGNKLLTYIHDTATSALAGTKENNDGN